MSVNGLFTPDIPCERPCPVIPGALIEQPAAVLSSRVSEAVRRRGDAFADEIEARFIADFERTEDRARACGAGEGDKMVHVSTFVHTGGWIYMTYYANTRTASEDPNFQTARLACCPDGHPDDMTFYDIQSVGDACGGGRVNLVYDTILAQTDADTLLILWTARVEDNYYRLCRPFSMKARTLGEVRVNRFRVGAVTNDFSATGITSALAASGIGVKKMFSDIGIMQKFTQRVEQGERWFYTGAYSGDFNAIIRSRDFITWEYVSQPDFPNLSKWENAAYVLGSRCYYFVRQHDTTLYGFLTAYDLESGRWERPVLLEDSQSRADFIFYRNGLYLFHAPIDREHIGIVRIDPDDLTASEIVVQAHMHSSCFYPFVQYYDEGELAMSYTVARRHIRLARFTLSEYLP